MNDDNFYAFLADNNAVVPLPPSMNDAATNTTADATADTSTSTLQKATTYLNNQNKTCALYKGHFYSMKHVKKDGDATMRCTNRSCVGRATVRMGSGGVALTKKRSIKL